MYGIYLCVIWTFDYLYAPWLAIKYKQFVFFPLYVSLFIISLAGLYMYNFFNEDMFFKKKIVQWLAEKGKWKITQWVKTKINSSPKVTFAVIAIWWSPLHSYVYFRDEDEKNIYTTLMVYIKDDNYKTSFILNFLSSCYPFLDSISFLFLNDTFEDNVWSHAQ